MLCSKKSALRLVAVLFGGVVSFNAAEAQARSSGSVVYWQVNGHYYQYLNAKFVTYQDAVFMASNLFAEGRQGYLATITSQAELDFVESSVIPSGTSTANIYLGARRIPGTVATWIWEFGPEKGTVFWDNGPIGGNFAPWDPIYALPLGSPASPARSDQPALYINGWYRPYFGSASGNALYSVSAGGNQGIIVEYSNP